MVDSVAGESESRLALKFTARSQKVSLLEGVFTVTLLAHDQFDASFRAFRHSSVARRP